MKDVEMLPSNFDGSQFNMALVNLQLDGFSSWEILLDMKTIYQNFPVLIYTLKSHDSITDLKETITMVLNENFR
ncbi:MAG: hypothetical protein KAU60_05700 [Desulfobacterales bacterium]|nr:hypothetical protein [Desulfobacterales bacterium]